MLERWSVVRTFSADVRRLLTAWGLISFGYFGVVGVLLNLYLLRLGFGIEFIGLMTALGQLLWAFTSLPAGEVGRRIGLRLALLLGYGLAALGMGLLLLVELLPQSLWAPWIIAGWMVSWLGAALNTVNATPFMMLAAKPSERNYAFAANSAVIAFMGFVGGAVAGLLPGLLASTFGWSLNGPAPYRTALWLTPLFYVLAMVAISGANPLRLDRPTGQDAAAGAPLGALAFLAALVFLQAAGGGAARAFFNVFLDTDLQVPASRIGAIMGVAQLLPVLVALLTPSLLERWGTERTLVLVGAGLGAGLAALGAASHWLVAGLSYAVVIAGVGMGGTTRNLFSQELVPLRWRSISAAVNSTGMAFGWAAAAALGGFLVGVIGFRGYFFASAALSLLSVGLLLTHLRVLRARPQAAPGD